MLSGAVNWARYTFVGPINFLQTSIASCRANMCTSDGPLHQETSHNQTITGHNHEKCLAQTCMILSTTKVLIKYIYRLYRRRIRCWLVNQHWVWWRGLGDTQRQARELISGPCLGAKDRFLSFNRKQSRAVTGLLTGHNTLRRHLHLMGLSDISLCRRCEGEKETSAHILCECEALASLRHAYLDSFFLEPEDINSISLGAIWNFSKVTGLP
jgi:hypothetical protein